METNTTKWILDPSHSEILFRVKHLMITNVKGEFRKFKAEVTTNGDGFNSASATAVIDATSLFTNEENRDNHLKSVDFFDIENYKEITFDAVSMNKVDDGNFKLTGNLTIKGITKPVTFDVEAGGIAKDPWGNEKAGFSLSGKINRKEWGLIWNAALETGGVLVGDEVKINAEVQFVKQ